VSVPMTLSDFERRYAMNQIYRADLFNNVRTVWPRTTKFSGITHVGTGVFQRISHAPPQGAGPQRSPNFLGSLLFLHTSLTQNYQIWRGNKYGAGVLLYLYLRKLTQNDQIRHNNTRGEGRVLGQPRHLHKCVARFVSDSWVSCF